MLEKIKAFLQVPPKILPWNWDKRFFSCWFLQWSSVWWWKPSFSVTGKDFKVILCKVGKIFHKTTVDKTPDSVNWDSPSKDPISADTKSVYKISLRQARWFTVQTDPPCPVSGSRHLLVSANKIWRDPFSFTFKWVISGLSYSLVESCSPYSQPSFSSATRSVMMSPCAKLSNVLLLPAVCGKIVFTFCLFIIFSPVATEAERDKLASSEFSVKKEKQSKKAKSATYTLAKLTAMRSLTGREKEIKEYWSASWVLRLGTALVCGQTPLTACLALTA